MTTPSAFRTPLPKISTASSEYRAISFPPFFIVRHCPHRPRLLRLSRKKEGNLQVRYLDFAYRTELWRGGRRERTPPMKQLRIIPDKCTGCLQCELACSFVQTGTFQPSRSVIRVYIFDEQ